MRNLSILKEKAELAFEVLESNTGYSKGKLIIKGFFENNDKLTKDIIEKQLTIIDSYYSTNMARRYYGIEEIAEFVISNLTDNKDELKNRFIKFTKEPNNDKPIIKLFNKHYGYRKTGVQFGKAISLISKYAFFVTDFNFPIYDAIVREVYPKLTGNYFDENNFLDFILKIRELLDESNISNYNKLDNLMWLIGKINRGNYSLILNKEKYLNLVSQIKGIESQKSEEVDKRIKDYINDNFNNLEDVFSPNQKDMIYFCKQLNM